LSGISVRKSAGRDRRLRVRSRHPGRHGDWTPGSPSTAARCDATPLTAYHSPGNATAAEKS